MKISIGSLRERLRKLGEIKEKTREGLMSKYQETERNHKRIF
jgi:hypothetical protein